MPACVLGSIKIHVEVPLFLLFFAFLVSDSVRSNLIIFRTCYVILGYNESECALLGSKNPDNQSASLEKMVQPHSSLITMAGSLIESLTTALFCIFAGPWSDRFGRKLMLILPVLGYLLFYVVTTIFTFVENASPWYLLYAYIPVAFTGGFPTYLTVMLCYITDVTSETNRGMRMAFFEASLYLGVFVGTVSSSYIFEASSYTTIFSLATICCALNVLFTLLFIPESLASSESEFQNKLEGFFQIANLTDMLDITFRKRQNYGRYTIICCILMTILSIVIMNGNDTVLFLFLREKFNFSLHTYTLFIALYSLVYVFGAILGVYILNKLLKVPETVMLLVAVISSLNGVLLMGLAHNLSTVYSVALARVLGGAFGPMLRSLISKVLPNEEIGKVFALVTSCQFLFGAAGSPLYTFVYNKTIDTNPSIFNFLSAGIYGLLLLIVVAVIVVRTAVGISENGTYNILLNDGEERHHSAEDTS